SACLSLVCYPPADGAPSLEARVFPRQAARLQSLRFAFEMELQLFAQVRLTLIAEHERSQTALQDVPQTHGYDLCSTRLTPADSRSHFATSAPSCVRPAFV